MSGGYAFRRRSIDAPVSRYAIALVALMALATASEAGSAGERPNDTPGSSGTSLLASSNPIAPAPPSRGTNGARPDDGLLRPPRSTSILPFLVNGGEVPRDASKVARGERQKGCYVQITPKNGSLLRYRLRLEGYNAADGRNEEKSARYTLDRRVDWRLVAEWTANGRRQRFTGGKSANRTDGEVVGVNIGGPVPFIPIEGLKMRFDASR